MQAQGVRGARRRACVGRAGAGKVGAQAGTRQERHWCWARAAGARQAVGERAAGARPRRWVRGVGARAGYGLCTRCTRPLSIQFDSVLFLSRFLDIIREPDS